MNVTSDMIKTAVCDDDALSQFVILESTSDLDLEDVKQSLCSADDSDLIFQAIQSALDITNVVDKVRNIEIFKDVWYE